MYLGHLAADREELSAVLSLGMCLLVHAGVVNFLPKPLGDLQRLDLEVFPPNDFVAGLMQLSMMPTAERDGELIADFEADGPGLGKPQVMWIGWLSAADQARL